MLASPWLCSRGRVLNNGLVEDRPDLVIEQKMAGSGGDMRTHCDISLGSSA